MNIRNTALAIVGAGAVAFAQSASGPTFDVVSIKKHVAQAGPQAFSSNVTQRPDGGFTMTNVPVTTLIARRRSPLSARPLKRKRRAAVLSGSQRAAAALHDSQRPGP